MIPLSDGTCKSDRPQQVVFSKRIENYVLAGPIVMTKLVSSDKECQMACILSMKCDTFNLGPRDESFRYICQILRFGVLKYSLKRKKGWSFRARKVNKACIVPKFISFIKRTVLKVPINLHFIIKKLFNGYALFYRVS